MVIAVKLFGASALWQLSFEGTTLVGVGEPITYVTVTFVSDQRTLETLRRSLAAIERSDPRARRFLIDNGSPEAWRVPVLELSVEHKMTYVRRRSNNIGAARDEALHLCETEYIAYIDSDVEIPPRWGERLSEFLEGSDGAPVLGAALSLRPPSGGPFARALSLAMASPLLHLNSAQALQAHRVTLVGHLATAAVLFRRKSLVGAGGFSGRFSRVCEDVDLSYRLQHFAKSKRCLALIPSNDVVHHQDRSAGPWAKRVFRYGWGQVEVARVHRRHFLSTKGLTVLFGAVVFWAAINGGFLIGGAAIYCLSIALGFFLFGSKPLRVGDIPAATLVSVLTHLSYTAGVWAGIFGIFRNPRVE